MPAPPRLSARRCSICPGRGTAVLVISQDLDELAEIADRIAVMFHGHLSLPVQAAEATREKLGLLMGGASATPPDEAAGGERRWSMQLVLEKRAERSTRIAIVSPLLAIALTLVTMSILFAILGKNPIAALNVYFVEPLTDSFTLMEIAVKATPLVMIAIGLSLCYLANVWNIGAEGQFIMGAVCGSWLAVVTNGTDAGYWVMPAMLVMGALGGALWAMIPALCKVKFGANEILTSLMLVYVADLIMDYLVRGPWRDPKGMNFPTTAVVRSSAPQCRLCSESRPSALGRDCCALIRRGAGRGDARAHHQGL